MSSKSSLDFGSSSVLSPMIFENSHHTPPQPPKNSYILMLQKPQNLELSQRPLSKHLVFKSLFDFFYGHQIGFRVWGLLISTGNNHSISSLTDFKGILGYIILKKSTYVYDFVTIIDIVAGTHNNLGLDMGTTVGVFLVVVDHGKGKLGFGLFLLAGH